MSGTRNQGKPKTPRYAAPEPRIGRIEFNPAPDAEDRLRRLFTLLASHLPGNDVTETEQEAVAQTLSVEDQGRPNADGG